MQLKTRVPQIPLAMCTDHWNLADCHQLGASHWRVCHTGGQCLLSLSGEKLMLQDLALPGSHSLLPRRSHLGEHNDVSFALPGAQS